MQRIIRYVGPGSLQYRAIYEVILDQGNMLDVGGGTINNITIYASDAVVHSFEVGDYVDYSGYATKYIIKDCHIDGTFTIVPEGAANLLTSAFRVLLSDLTAILDKSPFNFSGSTNPPANSFTNTSNATVVNTTNNNIPLDISSEAVTVSKKACDHKGINLSLTRALWCCKICGIDMKSETEV